MKLAMLFVQVVLVLSIAGCATGKSVTSADDVGDDGKRNTVLLTHDLKVYVTNKHSSLKQSKLTFRCPSGSDTLKPDCFSVELPFRGTKNIDGFGLYAFEEIGASPIQMKYGYYALQSVIHTVLIERLPETICTYNKKTKRDVCRTRVKEKSDRHRASFPFAVPIIVNQGSGCYIGHLSITMVDDQITEFNLDSDLPVKDEQLTSLSSDVAAELIRVVDRPCDLEVAG